MRNYEIEKDRMNLDGENLEVIGRPSSIKTEGGNLSAILEKNRKVLATKGVGDVALKPYVIETNSIGLRDDNISEKKKSNTRILVIGDSNAFGWGVNQSKRFTDLAERRLNSSHIEIINAAVPSWGMEDYLDFYNHIGMDFKPDIIVVALAYNDELSVEKQNEIIRNSSKPQEEGEEFLREKSNRKDSPLRSNARALVNQTGSKIMFYQVKPLKPGYGDFKDSLDNRDDVRYISLPSKLSKLDRSEFVLSPGKDGHYNEKGHKIVANKLYKNLIRYKQIRTNQD